MNADTIPNAPADLGKSIDAWIRKLREAKKAWDEFQRYSSCEIQPVVAMEKALQKLQSFSSSPMISLALPDASAEIKACEERLAQLKALRGNISDRRRELIQAAKEKKWSHESTGRADFLGPFQVEHEESFSLIRFGKFRLEKMLYPHPLELFEALERAHGHMEEEARKDLGDFLNALTAKYEELYAGTALSWAALLRAVIPDDKKINRMGTLLCYRLAMLIEGHNTQGWKIIATPPTLQEQKSAWSVPRLHRPNEVVRVSRIQLIRDKTPE